MSLWIELQWGIPRKLLDIVSVKLFALGAQGIQEDYLPDEKPPPRQPWDEGPEPPQPSTILLKSWWPLEQYSKAAVGVQVLHAKYPSLANPQWIRTSEADWGGDWRRHFKRKIISDTLIVAPPWEAQDGDLVIEPGIAFGTGEHPTTFSCLQAIGQWAQSGQRCLDVGCGSGILGVAAAHLGMYSYGVDIEPDAVTAANENAQKNQLDQLAQFACCPLQEVQGSYEVVVANLYAEVLVGLAPDIMRLSSGRIALAGILHDRVYMVKEAFAGLLLLREKQEGDWVSLWFSSEPTR